MHAYTSYNILLDHPSLNSLGVIVSTPHLAMKFTSDTESIIAVHADKRTTTESYLASLKLGPLTNNEPHRVVHYVEIVAGAERSKELDLNPRTNNDNRVKIIEETCTFQLDIKKE